MKLLIVLLFIPFISKAQLAPIYGIVQHGSEYWVKNYTANDSTLIDSSFSLATRLAVRLIAPQSGVGLGGTVVQTGNKSSAVTLHKRFGRITMTSSALAAGAEASFTLNNLFIQQSDLVLVNVQSIGTAGAYVVSVGSVSNGSCTITLSNVSTGSLSQAVVLNFRILNSVID